MSSVPALVRKPYRGAAMEGRLARWYARQTKGLTARFQSEGQEIAKGLAAGARILEVAPGPGYLAVEIAKLGAFDVSGLDVSRTFVEIATEHAARSRVKVVFRQGDAAAMPFEANAFDFIICRAAFKNFADPASVIAEMHRTLRPGGRAVIRDMRRDASNAALDNEVRAMRLGSFATVLNGFIFRQLRRRAYLSETLMRMAEAPPFGGAEVRQSAVGFDVVLTKARAGWADVPRCAATGSRYLD